MTFQKKKCLYWFVVVPINEAIPSQSLTRMNENWRKLIKNHYKMSKIGWKLTKQELKIMKKCWKTGENWLKLKKNRWEWSKIG